MPYLISTFGFAAVSRVILITQTHHVIPDCDCRLPSLKLAGALCNTLEYCMAYPTWISGLFTNFCLQSFLSDCHNSLLLMNFWLYSSSNSFESNDLFSHILYRSPSWVPISCPATLSSWFLGYRHHVLDMMPCPFVFALGFCICGRCFQTHRLSPIHPSNFPRSLVLTVLWIQTICQTLSDSTWDHSPI